MLYYYTRLISQNISYMKEKNELQYLNIEPIYLKFNITFEYTIIIMW